MKTRKKKKSSINNRIIGRMLVLVIVIALIILGGYTFVMYHDISTRAVSTIEAYLKDPEYYINDRSNTFIFVYELYASSNEKDYQAYDPENKSYYSYLPDTSETELIKQYYSDLSDYHYGEIYTYFSSSCFFFMPVDNIVWRQEYDWRIFNEETMDVLIYCDVTYLLHMLFNNVALVGAIVAAMILLLFFVSRYTVRMLDQKDTGMKNFFANASHELKTPLMSIKGNVDGIREGYVETEQGCEVIERQVDRMSELIGAILDISRLDSKAVEPQMLDCDVREIIYDAASAVVQEARRRGILLDMDIPDPIFRKCDEAMMFSAFSNILTNDVRYAASFIRVSTRKNEKNGRVNIRFENDGVPVSESDRQHIFDRFYKGDKGQSGIGMALAQEYVKLHGSEIKVGVEHGNTVFEIEI